MIKIIEHGNPLRLQKKKPVRQFICINCACVFQADKYISSCEDHNESYLYHTCPECGRAAYSPNQN